jgi:hypothetical protein
MVLISTRGYSHVKRTDLFALLLRKVSYSATFLNCTSHHCKPGWHHVQAGRTAFPVFSGICMKKYQYKTMASTQFIIVGLHANILTGFQAGIYAHTFDIPGTSGNIHVYIGPLTREIVRMYENWTLLVDCTS